MKKMLIAATVESHILNFHIPYIKYFQEKGFEVHVAARMSDRKGEFEKLNVILHDIPFSRRLNPFQNLKAYFKVKMLLKKEKFSLIHVHTPVAAFMVRLAAKNISKFNENNGIKCKVLYTAHGFHFYKGAPLKNRIFYYNAERIAAKWTDGLITINKEDYEAAKKFKYKNGGKAYYVNGVGIDTDYYKKLDININEYKEKLGIRDNDVVIFTAAELMYGKNYIQAFDAVKLLIEKLSNSLNAKYNIRYLVAGDGILEEKLKKYIQDNKLSNTVSFLGFRKDMPEILNICDIFLFTSYREGLPRCIMEAMACGKPIIATDIRGNHDLVCDKRNGFLVKCNDAVDTADKLQKLITNKQLCIEMGNEGRQMIEEYSINKVIKHMADIYEECLNSKQDKDNNETEQNITTSG